MINSFSVTLTAGVPARINVGGAFFRLLTGSGVDVSFLHGGARLGSATGMNGGFYARSKDGESFDGVELLSATGQTVDLLIGEAEAGAASAVSISGGVETFDRNYTPVDAYAYATVGTTSAMALAARANRRFLIVQNQGATDLYMNYGFLPALIGLCLKLTPGQTLFFDAVCPNSQINMVSSAAGGLAVFQEGV